LEIHLQQLVIVEILLLIMVVSTFTYLRMIYLGQTITTYKMFTFI